MTETTILAFVFGVIFGVMLVTLISGVTITVKHKPHECGRCREMRGENERLKSEMGLLVQQLEYIHNCAVQSGGDWAMMVAKRSLERYIKQMTEGDNIP